MAIATSCYIREIKKEDKALLKKAGKIFNLNTTPSILMRLLKEFFSNRKLIEKQEKQIAKLDGQLYKAVQELENYKFEVGHMFKLENELNKQREKIKSI